MKYDKIIVGAGLYGLYSAIYCGKKGEKVLVLEYDGASFMRATFINQARVHMGYHYPRSYSTAIKSKNYFDKFNDDFGYSVHSSFEKIYAISKVFSWTSGEQFQKFCRDANIKCESIDKSKYFNEALCDGAYSTTEYTYDSDILRDKLLEDVSKYPNVEIVYNARISKIEKSGDIFKVYNLENIYETPYLLNATYASVNQIIDLLNFYPFKIKYELCEIILCRVNEKLNNVGITVMDGPFFSIMPFGKTGFHSLTSVTFTPHTTSYDNLPTFKCQSKSNGYCSPRQLGNCNECIAKPKSAWNHMSRLAKKYLVDDLEFEYEKSLFSIKPILMASEIDDSRPTVVKVFCENPTFVSVLSGKINTVYDLEEVLNND